MDINKISQKIICLGLAAFLSISGFPVITHAESAEKVIMPYDMEWSYSDDGKDLGTAWLNNDYDCSSWKKGKAPFGFGDAVSETNPNIPLSTEIGFGNDENNKHMTTYAKTEIEIDSLESFEALENPGCSQSLEAFAQH